MRTHTHTYTGWFMSPSMSLCLAPTLRHTHWHIHGCHWYRHCWTSLAWVFSISIPHTLTYTRSRYRGNANQIQSDLSFVHMRTHIHLYTILIQIPFLFLPFSLIHAHTHFHTQTHIVMIYTNCWTSCVSTQSSFERGCWRIVGDASVTTAQWRRARNLTNLGYPQVPGSIPTKNSSI